MRVWFFLDCVLVALNVNDDFDKVKLYIDELYCIFDVAYYIFLIFSQQSRKTLFFNSL